MVCTEASDMWALGMVFYVTVLRCIFLRSVTESFSLGNIIRGNFICSLRRYICDIHDLQCDLAERASQEAGKSPCYRSKALEDMPGLLELQARESPDR